MVQVILPLRQEASNKKTFFNIDASDSIGKSYEIENEVLFYSRNFLTSLLIRAFTTIMEIAISGCRRMLCNRHGK